MPDVPRGTPTGGIAVQPLAYTVKRKLTFPLGVFVSLWVVWAILMAAFAIDCFVTRNKPGYNVPMGPIGSFEVFGGLFTAGYFVFATTLTGAIWVYRALRLRRAAKLAEMPSSTPAPSAGS